MAVIIGPPTIIGPFPVPIDVPPYVPPERGGVYSIDGNQFGKGKGRIYIQSTQIVPAMGQQPSIQDSALPGNDGIMFGQDTVMGNQITFTGYVVARQGDGGTHLFGGTDSQPVDLGFSTQGGSTIPDPLGAHQAFNRFAAVWNNPAVRLSPHQLSHLSLWYPYSSERRFVWGRGRAITPQMGFVNQGVIPFVATFQAADANFYSYASNTLTLSRYLGSVVFPQGGITPAQTPAAITNFGPQNHQRKRLVNAGFLPTWPIIHFTGFGHSPSLTIVATGKKIGYDGNIGGARHVTIDCRPWVRAAYFSEAGNAAATSQAAMANTPSLGPTGVYGQNFSDSGLPAAHGVAGHLTGNARIEDMYLPAGTTEVFFDAGSVGYYPQADAHCTITWWTANSSIGG